MGPGSLFTCFGPVPLTRCKREDQGETSTPCLPRHGTPGAKPEQRIDPNDAGHQRQRRETLVSAKALPRRSGPGELRSVSPVPGVRGKADCGTQAEPWSRRERPPASLWSLSVPLERDPPRRSGPAHLRKRLGNSRTPSSPLRSHRSAPAGSERLRCLSPPIEIHILSTVSQ